jgi:hypothetical protein
MFALSYLDRHGIACVVGESEGKVSMKHSTRGTNFGLRESAYEGWINVEVASGDVISVGDELYLVISPEGSMGATFFTALKTNAVLDSQEESWSEDDDGNPILKWTSKASNIPSYGQIVTSALRQTDPGILNTTTRIYYLNAPVKVLGRVIHHYSKEDVVDMGGFYESPGMKLKVDSIDDIMLPNVKRIQCSNDTR